MPMQRRRLFLLPGVLGLSLSVGACKEDPPTPKLFQEDGVWSVVNYDLTGSGDLKEIDTMNRRDAFMLHFDATEQVVTTASCVEDATDTPASSTCLLTPTTTEWLCQCFGYDFVRDEMLWREFDAGDIPPDVSLADLDDPGGGMASGTDGGGGDGDDTLISLAEIPDVSSTYNFRPLPEGVFGSDGESSRYIFEARAASLFDRVFDDPDGRPGCEPCIP